MPKLLEICELGNPILRTRKAKKVTNISDPKIQELIDDMIHSCHAANGMGISAPQVNHSLQLFIMSSNPNSRYPKAPFMEPTAIINPKIISTSKGEEQGWEGCLSIPGIRINVFRQTSLKVLYTDRHGKLKRKTFEGFLARIFQHEFDHIKGITILDRFEALYDVISEKEYQKRMAKEAEEEAASLSYKPPPGPNPDTDPDE